MNLKNMMTRTNRIEQIIDDVFGLERDEVIEVTFRLLEHLNAHDSARELEEMYPFLKEKQNEVG